MQILALWVLTTQEYPIGGSRGGTRDERPPGGPNSFIFMQFSATNWKIITFLGVGTPPWGKSWIRHCTPLQKNWNLGTSRHFEFWLPKNTPPLHLQLECVETNHCIRQGYCLNGSLKDFSSNFYLYEINATNGIWKYEYAHGHKWFMLLELNRTSGVQILLYGRFYQILLIRRK